MPRRRNDREPWGDLAGSGGVLGDDGGALFAAALSAAGGATHHCRSPLIDDLSDRVARLESQVLQQYSVMAAYATIAEQRADEVRSEAYQVAVRAEALMIGMLDQQRGDGVELAKRVDELAGAVARVVRNQCLVAEQWRQLLERQTSCSGGSAAGWPTVVDRDQSATDERMRGAATARS